MARWMNKLATFMACAGCVAIVENAGAQGATAPDWVGDTKNERGQACEKYAERQEGPKLLVACGAAGVWEFSQAEPTLRFVRSYDFGGDVIGFLADADGRLWVKLKVVEARPFATRPGESPTVAFPDAAPPEGAPPPLPPPPVTKPPSAPAPAAAPAPAPKKLGRVTRSSPGEVVISLGTLDRVGRSDRIELAVEVTNTNDYDAAALSRETVAIGVVTNVSEHSARVQLGVNESVPVGAIATPTQAHTTASLSAPPRVTGLWDLQFAARPFAALGELGGGALLSGGLGYRLGHLRLQAILDPLAFGDVQDKKAIFAASGAAIASYDSQYFEMGLGFGGQTVNEAGFFVDPGSGLTALQILRLGALDGLNIGVRTNIVLFHSEFQFGGMVGTGQIPVTRGYWLLLNGGGGNIGYGFGELGLRVLLAGNGLAGSKFLTVTAGGAAVFKSGTCPDFEFCSQSSTYGGPMAGVGGEWRF
jgi:hypothetical protein